RDTESAALTLSLGVQSPALQQRLLHGDGATHDLNALVRLLDDSPDQLVRLGRIESLLEHRMDLARQIARSTESPERKALIEEMTFEYPIRPLVEELQLRENQLLAERTLKARRQQHLSSVVTWSA